LAPLLGCAVGHQLVERLGYVGKPLLNPVC
jgi:hypothetical protein